MKRTLVRTACAGVVLCVLSACTGDPGTGGSSPSGDAAARENTAWYEEAAGGLGIDFHHHSGASGGFFLPEIMGGGVAAFDADGDGDLDLYFVNQNDGLPQTTVVGPQVNRFYRQADDGTFSDDTERSGLGDGGFGMGVAVADVDGDGFDDLYVSNLGPDRLYLNRGDGTFVDRTEASGIKVPGWSGSATFGDFDRDGHPDLYVTQYLLWDGAKRCLNRAGAPSYCGPAAFPSARDVMLRNQGDGTFRDWTRESGIMARGGAGLGVIAADIDEDGWADIYVANDGDPNYLWINRGDGTFVDDAPMRGVALNNAGQAEAGMGVMLEDLNNDGLSDLFITHLDRETNTFYRNLGGRLGFEDSTAAAGLASDSRNLTGFGTAALDADLDGDLDMLVVNGRVTMRETNFPPGTSSPWDRLAEPDLFYENDGAGGFRLTDSVGAWLKREEVSRGAVAADLDQDGDLDLVITAVEAPARVLRRRGAPATGWLAVHPAAEVRDTATTRVSLYSSRSHQTRDLSRGSSYLSSRPPRAHFGLPAPAEARALELCWPQDRRQVLHDVPEDRILVVPGPAGSG